MKGAYILKPKILASFRQFLSVSINDGAFIVTIFFLLLILIDS